MGVAMGVVLTVRACAIVAGEETTAPRSFARTTVVHTVHVKAMPGVCARMDFLERDALLHQDAQMVAPIMVTVWLSLDRRKVPSVNATRALPVLPVKWKSAPVHPVGKCAQDMDLATIKN